jgi:hypothetical protein
MTRIAIVVYPRYTALISSDPTRHCGRRVAAGGRHL